MFVLSICFPCFVDIHALSMTEGYNEGLRELLRNLSTQRLDGLVVISGTHSIFPDITILVALNACQAFKLTASGFQTGATGQELNLEHRSIAVNLWLDFLRLHFFLWFGRLFHKCVLFCRLFN